MIVEDVLEDVRADEYIIQGTNKGEIIPWNEQHWSDKTVHDANPSYEDDETVVIVTYQSGDQEYAFPESRLSRLYGREPDGLTMTEALLNE